MFAHRPAAQAVALSALKAARRCDLPRTCSKKAHGSTNTPAHSRRPPVVRLCTQQHSPAAYREVCASSRRVVGGLVNAHSRLRV